MRTGRLAEHCTSSFSALSYRFAVRSDDRELGRHVDEVLAGLRDTQTAPPVEHWYSLTHSAGDAGRVDVRRDDVDVALGQRPGDAVGWVVCDLNRTAAEASGEHLLLHAGALDAGGTGVLVPGCSGSGKSTLVAGLARAGLAYLTDELAALELSSGHLQPYAKPITIKRGSFDALRDLHRSAEPDPLPAARSGGEWQVPVGPGTGRSVGCPCAPGIVVLPRYEPGAVTALTPLSDTEAFLYLALNAVNLLPHGAAGTAALGELVTRCRCVALTMSDLDAACALVLGLVEEHTARLGVAVGADAG
jgi:hypothetical protein